MDKRFKSPSLVDPSRAISTDMGSGGMGSLPSTVLTNSTMIFLSGLSSTDFCYTERGKGGNLRIDVVALECLNLNRRLTIDRPAAHGDNNTFIH